MSVPEAAETRDATPIGRRCIDRPLQVCAAAGMHHVVGRSGDRTLVPAIVQVEAQRGMHADGGVQARRRLPGAVAHAAHVLAARPGRSERQLDAVDGDVMPLRRDAEDSHL